MAASPAIETIARENDRCGESPLWDPATETLHWVDITGKRMHSLRKANGTPETRPVSFGLSVLGLRSSSGLIVAGADGILLMDGSGLAQPFAAAHEGEPLAINDGIVDPKGRFLAGSTHFDGSDAYCHGALYRLDLDGSLAVLDDGFRLANGMGFSSNGETFYATDSIERVIYHYDYDAASGSVSGKRLFVKLQETEGLPDGLTVDAEDFVWSALWFGGCVCRFDPDGGLERRIAIPAQQSSSIAFGGRDYGEAFVTSASEWDALSAAPAGYSTAGRHAGGELFRFRTDVQGKPEHRCLVSRSL